MNTDTKTITPVQELRESQPANLVMHQGGREVSIFEKAIDVLLRRPDANLDQLQQMMQMHERFEERQAEKAFVEAMSEFKKNPPKIVKDKANGFTNRDGEFVGYMSATLAAVCEAAIKGLAEVGISHKWEVEQQAGQVKVACVLTHRAGHSERTSIEAPADNSGKKNAIQSIASSITYLERYTLLAATGLAAEDQDDDGAGHSDPFLQWAREIVATMEKADSWESLKAVRKAAAERCTREKAQREWNELINPAYKRISEAHGWVHVEQTGG